MTDYEGLFEEDDSDEGTSSPDEDEFADSDSFDFGGGSSSFGGGSSSLGGSSRSRTETTDRSTSRSSASSAPSPDELKGSTPVQSGGLPEPSSDNVGTRDFNL